MYDKHKHNMAYSLLGPSGMHILCVQKTVDILPEHVLELLTALPGKAVSRHRLKLPFEFNGSQWNLPLVDWDESLGIVFVGEKRDLTAVWY
jgi:hypothetical protein